MVKKCVYCGTPVSDESVIDFCERCGISTFGSKMFAAIIDNMKQAQSRGDLDQGSIN